MNPEFSLVVVTWESTDDLAELVDSMLEHLPADGSVELVVVDNASSKDPTEIASRWSGPVQVEKLASNRGFGAASNRGVAIAGAPVVVLCNPDIRLIDDSLLRLANLSAERNAFVGPRLLWADGSKQPSSSGPVTGVWPWVGALLPGSIQPDWMLEKTEPWRLERTVEVTWLTGAVVAGPTELMKQLGPFDEGIEMMSEDLDLGLRAERRGIKCIFAPTLATLIHIGGTSTKKRFDDDGLLLSAMNREAVIRKLEGAGPARRSALALMVRLRLRIVAKSALRRDTEAECAELAALVTASRAHGRS